MAITIRGIRITSLTISRDEDGTDSVRCDYQLVSSEDKVLAKQSVATKSSYHGADIFVPPSDVSKQLSEAVMKYKLAIEADLGIT